MMHPATASFLGYPLYQEFRIEDESTYARLCSDAKMFFEEHPAIGEFYCWVPQFGLICVKREALGGAYAVA